MSVHVSTNWTCSKKIGDLQMIFPGLRRGKPMEIGRDILSYLGITWQETHTDTHETPIYFDVD
jgi:hypothetical protein